MNFLNIAIINMLNLLHQLSQSLLYPYEALALDPTIATHRSYSGA